jgi:uncharacterized protein (TIRG00374 family)
MSDSYENIVLTDAPPLPAIPHTRRQERKWLVLLLLLGLASTLVLTSFAGNAQTFALLRDANLFFVALIALTQVVRYAAMTLSTRVVAELEQVRVPMLPLFQVTVAAQAANRTFVGGAAGLVIRLAFFLRHQMHSGTFLAVETIEDSVSLVAVALLFGAGLTVVVTSNVAANLRWDVIGIFVGGALALTAAVLALLRQRAWVEQLADALAQGVNRLVEKFAHRNLYDAERVRGGVNDFYRALALARRDPLRVWVSFCCALTRLSCDAVALYLAYGAIGYPIAPGTVLLIFIVSTSVATMTVVPGQIGVMETSLSLMSTALGVPLPMAVSASLLFRVISFWLPVPFGYAFAWQLQRREMI